jgi:hypothetical protein
MRPLALAALALLIALPASAAPGPAAKTKNTAGWIESLAMDGPRVAYAVEGSGGGCTKVVVWNVLTGSAALASGQATCAADSTSTGGGVTQIAIAGTRLAWVVNQGGNTESSDSLYTASLPAPKERLLVSTVRTGDVDGTLTGGWIGGLVGSGDRIAVNRWTTNESGEVQTGTLQRVGAGLSTVSSGTTALHAQTLDLRRVAVLRASGDVAVYDIDSGGLYVTVKPSSARQVALRNDYIVVLTRTNSIEIYNSHSGAFIRKWPVAAGASRLDVHSGIVVYPVGRTVHALRLSDGSDAIVATAPRAVEGLAIERPGIVYAYNTVKGVKDVGNLAFVPLVKVNALL